MQARDWIHRFWNGCAGVYAGEPDHGFGGPGRFGLRPAAVVCNPTASGGNAPSPCASLTALGACCHDRIAADLPADLMAHECRHAPREFRLRHSNSPRHQISAATFTCMKGNRP